jgi:hypothetical protein
MTNETALRITGILIGGFLSLIFVGYMILTFSERKRQTGASAPQKFAGAFSLTLGIVMAAAWAYFMVTGWTSFWNQPTTLSIHVLTELLSSVMLVAAGIGMLRSWSRGPALFMIANGSLLFTTMLALTAYGMTGHPFLMNGITIFLVIVSVYMVGLVYGWEHFVLRLDEPEPGEKKKAA